MSVNFVVLEHSTIMRPVQNALLSVQTRNLDIDECIWNAEYAYLTSRYTIRDVLKHILYDS